MRKFAGPALAALSVLLLSTGSAQAACHSLRCVNRQVNSLKKQVGALGSEVNALSAALVSANARIANDEATINHDDQRLNSLGTCLAEAPLTRYGASNGAFGYVFNPGNGGALFDTTALDVTSSGDPVGGWALFDQCNTTTTAAAISGVRHLAPSLPPSFFGRQQPRKQSRR